MKRLRRPRLIKRGALLLPLMAGCGTADRALPAGDPDSLAAASVTELRPGIRFDPATLRPGDTVGGLVVDSILARRNIVDSTYVGVAWFEGRIELSGHAVDHFDADLRDTSWCFEADSASAARLPRWLHDERRAWFCFSNPEVARRALGPPDTSAFLTITVDRFTIQRGLTDQVNSGRFVARVAR